MSREPDEDLIEATIRRIQAQNTGGQPEASEDRSDEQYDAIQATIRRVREQAAAHAEAAGPADSEDPIEATIRRVREQAAASTQPEPAVGDDAVDEDSIEATIRRVQEQASASTEPEGQPGDEDVVDEDAIAATVRRVQEQAAAATVESAPQARDEPMADDAGDDPIAAAIRRVAEAKAQREAESYEDDDDEGAPVRVPAHELPRSDLVEEAIIAAERNGASDDDAFAAPAAVRPPEEERAPPPEPTDWPGRDERMLGEPPSWEVAAQRLEQGLQDTQREVRTMAARLDALLPALERLVQPASGQPPLRVVPPQPAADDDFDDTPQVSAMQFGAPPRPAILRDPSPMTATAAELIEEPAPTPQPERPAAAAPRLRAIDADGKLGSHLPRQYRITVEDKRRGVDLVPLHRAMQSLANLKDMSLLSYSNGVAIVAVESIGEIDPEGLRAAVARAMSRETKIEVHNEQTMVVKIQEE